MNERDDERSGNAALSPEALKNEVIHRWNNRQSARSMARELGVSRWKVKQLILAQAAAREVQSSSQTQAPPASLGSPARHRGSKLDAFEPQLKQLLERYPRITATRAWEELKRSGYDGGYTMLRLRVKQLRVRPAQPLTVRFETAPGVQAQMDWSTYEIDFTQEGKRRVNLFSYVLGYSRRQYIRFTERQDFDSTIRQHIQAFEHLGGVAATCLYDNMKVVVTRWEDDQPIYNTRFLALATHYGYKPWACQVRRPQTKGKVERPFYYIETNLLNGREFRSFEHLNDVARWWLTQVADVRLHGTTKKTPLELHAEELPHLLPLPALKFDTAQVVYRVVDTDGRILYANNRYSVPWQLVGELLPIRVTEDELMVYNRSLSEVARHGLLLNQSGQQRVDPAHAPPRDHQAQLERLRERFAELGQLGSQFLDGLMSKQRHAKHQAQRVLALLQAYPKADVLAAMERAIRYRAYGFSSLERILAHLGTPKPTWQNLSESEQETLKKLTDAKPIGPRRSEEYQHLLENDHDQRAQEIQQKFQFDDQLTDQGTAENNSSREDTQSVEGNSADTPRLDPETPPDTEDPHDSGTT